MDLKFIWFLEERRELGQLNVTDTPKARLNHVPEALAWEESCPWWLGPRTAENVLSAWAYWSHLQPSPWMFSLDQCCLVAPSNVQTITVIGCFSCHKPEMPPFELKKRGRKALWTNTSICMEQLQSTELESKPQRNSKFSSSHIEKKKEK